VYLAESDVEAAVGGFAPRSAGSFATNCWRWSILMIGTVRGGVPREDRYPVRVEE
jgi:hypothetical protein